MFLRRVENLCQAKKQEKNLFPTNQQLFLGKKSSSAMTTHGKDRIPVEST